MPNFSSSGIVVRSTKVVIPDGYIEVTNPCYNDRYYIYNILNDTLDVVEYIGMTDKTHVVNQDGHVRPVDPTEILVDAVKTCVIPSQVIADTISLIRSLRDHSNRPQELIDESYEILGRLSTFLEAARS